MLVKRLLTGGSLVALLGVSVILASPLAHASTSGSCWDYKGAERRLARKINRARSRADRVRLHLDPQLSQVARKHARAMSSKRSLFHDPQALRRRVTRWRSLGENVGAGSGAASIHRAFMRSAGHRYNILWRDFRHVGVGVKRAGGRLWVTVVFESRVNPGTTLPPPSY